MSIDAAYHLLYTAALMFLSVLITVMLIRCAREPGITDRLLSINMIGTLIIAMIVILSRLLEEDWLIDIALIYTMISVVSVLVLARVYIPKEPDRKPFENESEEGGKDNG